MNQELQQYIQKKYFRNMKCFIPIIWHILTMSLTMLRF